MPGESPSNRRARRPHSKSEANASSSAAPSRTRNRIGTSITGWQIAGLAAAVGSLVLAAWWGISRTPRGTNAPPRHPPASVDARSEKPRSDDSPSAGRDLSEFNLPLRPADTPVQRVAAKMDTASDSWQSEALTERVNGQLNQLAHVIDDWVTHPAEMREKLRTLLDPRFVGDDLRPLSLATAAFPGGVRVRRMQAPAEAQQGERDRDVAKGAERFGDTLDELLSPLAETSSLAWHAKFKLVHIELADIVLPDTESSETPVDGHGPTRITTQLRFELTGGGERSSLQQTAAWDCEWTAVGNDPPSLAAARITDFEEVWVDLPSSTWFDDCTYAVMSANRAYREQVLPGIPYWSRRLSREFMTQFGHNGVAIGDCNGDGWDDVYVCDTGGLPNRLYLHRSDGTVEDVSDDSGVDFLEDSTGALFVDLDNDGDQDLVVASHPFLQFAENNGHGQFTLHAGFYANTDAYSLSAADVDGDRFVDIYVCGYNARKPDPTTSELPFPLPYNDANNGGRNYLLRNDGRFGFRDVTAEVGLDTNNTRFSLAAAWEDYDRDGDLDLYVANDFGRNCLYRNDQGVFRDVAAEAGVEDQASGMSVSWGDFDRDGWPDIYVSNMFSAAGNRITYQRQFSTGLQNATVAGLQRMARGNTLFRNRGDGTFQDVSESANVTMGRWAWASRFLDVNCDGWDDLIVANGYATNDDTGDL